MNIRYLLITLTAILLIGGSIWFFKSSKKEAQIPRLLDRKGGLSLTAEWKNTKQSINTLTDKIRKNPKDYTSKLMLAYAFIQEARVTGEHPYYYPAAMKLIDDVLDNTQPKDPIHPKALVAKASVQLSLHQFGDALETGKEAVKMDPENKDLYGVLCDANVELGHYEEAVKMADKMVELRPELQSYSRVSYLREIYGDLPGAIQAMQLAVGAGYPGFEQTSWTRYNLGKLYEKSGDTARARAEYETVVSQDMHYAFAVGGLAGLAAKAGDTQKALALYTRALDMMPEFSFQQEIARIYAQKGDPKAKEALEKTVAMLKEDEEAGHNADLELANLYMTVGKDYDKAEKYAEKELHRRPDNIDVNKAMALVKLNKGEKAEAKTYAAKALRTGRKDRELTNL